MRALIGKDLGVNRAAIIGAMAVLGIPYVMFVAVMLIYYRLWPEAPVGDTRWLASGLITASTAGLFLTGIMGAVFGGMAFALERRERSANFLAMMPVSRGRIIVSKILIVTAPLLIMWAINTGVSVLSHLPFAMHYPSMYQNMVSMYREVEFFEEVILPTVGLIMLFGIAWLMSVLLSSPAISVSVSMGVTIAATIAFALYCNDVHMNEIRSERIVEVCGTCAGIISFLVGSAHYMRRVEP